ncbi:mediator of RNA polymerase II transcription subunit 29-like [Penaeus vannamei]|uniref:mediator of RNA polymerase II transcription subunit 29 n=1 Tax=Penaeus vannamei TaxID=6689 RepID=UPI00387F5369
MMNQGHNPQMMNAQMSQQQAMMQQNQQAGMGPQQGMQQSQQAQEQHQQQQQTQQQQQQQQQQANQQQEQKDSISRIKHHYWQMKDALMETLGCASTNIANNTQVDQGLRNAGEVPHTKFEESIEKFYTLCDQIEINLQTAIDCQLQGAASQKYTPSPISTPPVDVQKYAHYLSTVRNQVVYAKDIHTALVDAATSMSNMNTTTMTTMDSSN